MSPENKRNFLIPRSEISNNVYGFKKAQVGNYLLLSTYILSPVIV